MLGARWQRAQQEYVTQRPAGRRSWSSQFSAYLDHFPCDGAEEHDFMCIVSAVLICQLALLNGTTEEIPAGCYIKVSRCDMSL